MGVPVVGQLVSICAFLPLRTVSFLPHYPHLRLLDLAALLSLDHNVSSTHNPNTTPYSPPSRPSPLLPLTTRTENQHTLFPPQPIPDTDAAIPEFRLRGLELAERCGQMLQFLRELVLDVVELGCGEGGEVD